MSLKLEWMGLAEGATVDVRGSVALIGWNPLSLTVAAMPTRVALHVLLFAEDDDPPSAVLTQGRPLSVKVNVTGPDNTTLFYDEQTSALEIPPARRVDLPQRLQVMAQVPIEVTKAGKYRYGVRVDFPDLPDIHVSGSRSIWMLDPNERHAD